MKKLFLVGFLVLGVSSLAFAWHGGMGGGHNGGGYGHNGGGMGYNCGNCYNGNGMMGGQGMGNGQNNNMPAVTVVTPDEAKAKVQAVIDQNYKGYKISKVESFQTPRGINAYKVSVADASGNPFLFHVNPWGNVVGPMLNK